MEVLNNLNVLFTTETISGASRERLEREKKLKRHMADSLARRAEHSKSDEKLNLIRRVNQREVAR